MDFITRFVLKPLLWATGFPFFLVGVLAGVAIAAFIAGRDQMFAVLKQFD